MPFKKFLKFHFKDFNTQNSVESKPNLEIGQNFESLFMHGKHKHSKIPRGGRGVSHLREVILAGKFEIHSAVF